MRSTALLIPKLKHDYSQFDFKESVRFSWSPSEQTVYYTSKAEDCSFLLHELSHGLLGHTDYSHDIELIAMERAAWDKAHQLARTYSVAVSENLVETTLDSYREWLHARSTCPRCSATGLQTKKKTYHCPACSHNWQVNEARLCGLRRTNTT